MTSLDGINRVPSRLVRKMANSARTVNQNQRNTLMNNLESWKESRGQGPLKPFCQLNQTRSARPHHGLFWNDVCNRGEAARAANQKRRTRTALVLPALPAHSPARL